MRDSAILHVTFDRNVCANIQNSSCTPSAADEDVYSRVLKAIRHGRIRPYLSEATLTFELFSRDDRPLILAHYFARGELRPPMPKPTPEAQAWVADLLALGFCVLHAPPRAGLASFIPLDTGWAADLRFTQEERQKRQHEIAEYFEHLGVPRLWAWGNKLAKAHGLDLPTKEQPFSRCPGLLWFNGLMAEYQDPIECSSQNDFLGKLRKIFSDWFDLDSVASHFGYGFDYFCTTDTGRGEMKQSIFHPENRRILREKYGVRVVGPEEILTILSNTNKGG